MADKERDLLFAPSSGKARKAEAPIFALDREDRWRVQGARLGSVRLVSAGGGTVLIVTSDGHVVRWSAADDTPPEAIELLGARADARVHAIFVDPTGQHAIVSVTLPGSGATYHVEPGKRSARELGALRGSLVTAVAWNFSRPADGVRLGPCLLGTSNGRVLELRIDAERRDGGATPGGAATRLWQVPDTEALPITGLRLETLPPAPGVTGSRYYALVVTSRPQRLYQFVGGPTLEALFSGVGGGALTFNEIRAPVEVPSPELAFVAGGAQFAGGGGGGKASLAAASSAAPPPTPASRADCFVMLTGVGLYAGRLTLSNYSGGGAGDSSSSLISDPLMLAYPNAQAAADTARPSAGPDAALAVPSALQASAGPPAAPIGLAVTDFHILLLFKGRLVALSRVSPGAVAAEVPLPEDKYGAMRGMWTDTTFATAGAGGSTGAAGVTDSAAVWLWSDRALYMLVIAKEDRDVWRLHLARGDYDAAARACTRRGDAAAAESVALAQAEALFGAGRWEEAAAAYARTSSRPFEEQCLRFLHAPQPARVGLKALLVARLRGVRGDGPDAKLQRTVLATWLTEFYLDALNAATAAPPGTTTTTAPSASAASLTAPAEALRAEFRRFLTEFAAPSPSGTSAVDPRTTLALMAGHGRTDELLFFARLIGDSHRVVSHFVSRAEWGAALRELRALTQVAASISSGSGTTGADRLPPIPSAARISELWVAYSPALLPHEPAETCSGWRSAGRMLDPTLLLPALSLYATAMGLLAPAASASRGGSASATGGGAPPPLDPVLVYLDWALRTAPRSQVGGGGRTCRALHDLLFALYAAQPVEELLLDYIAEQTEGMVRGAAPFRTETGAGAVAALALGAAPDDGGGFAEPPPEDDTTDDAVGARPSAPRFDMSAALRQCIARRRHRGTVMLYTAMGLLTDAVEVALEHSLTDLARAAASAAPEGAAGDEIRRRLWTRIAGWTCSRRGATPADALAVLADAGGALHIDDVLAMLPAATRIDDFRDQVGASLGEADAAVAELRREMHALDAAADGVRADIRALRNRCGVVRAGQRCELCSAPLLASPSSGGGGGGGAPDGADDGGGASATAAATAAAPGGGLYVFTCSHAYHRDCLLAEVAGRHLGATARRRVEALLSNIGSASALLYALVDSGGSSDARGNAAQGRPGGGVRWDAGAAAALLGGTAPSDPRELRAALDTARGDWSRELDRLVAGECLLCGDVMIESVARPLGDDGDGTEEGGAEDWSV